MSTAALAPKPQASMGTEGTGNTTGGPCPTSRQMRCLFSPLFPHASHVLTSLLSPVKVSYTFDDASQSQCLARWPHLVSTPVVQVDPDLLVGAVELKTCILSIISASPELVATLGQDYSVYAYDFSEAGFPLVGCGMLSWAMLNTQNSPTRIMVTGRVSCNTFAFFSNDAIKETLEVKFKLQKVETFTQEQFVRSVHAYTALARSLPGDFDPSSWSTFINQNPQILAAQNPEKPLAIEPPSAYQASIPPPPPPPPAAPVPQWNEQTNMSASEESSQPARKRQRTAPRRPTKPSVPRKKCGSAAASPAEFPPSSQQLTDDARQSFQAPSDCEPAMSHSRSRESSTIQFQPLSEPSPAMASSPPTQSEAGDGVISPAPTSPVLPALPDVRAPEPPRTMQSLYEEPVLAHQTQPRGGLVLPGRRQYSSVPPEDVPPSAESIQAVKAAKKPRRRPVKQIVPVDPICPSSDAVCESGPGIQRGVGVDKIIIKPKPSNNTRTAKHVKERIQSQLVEAVKRGHMPNYCMNCGAIETAVWRKVRLDTKSSKDPCRGADAQPKREDREGTEAGKECEEREKEERSKEVLLCNACGLWFLSHKTMRPQNLWDVPQKSDQASTKGTNPKKRKKSLGVPTPPASSAIQPPSEPATEPIVLQDEDATPRAPVPDTSMATPSAASSTVKGPSRYNSGITASQAVRSSPVMGSADSPIDLDAEIDGAPSPRRLLFPSARKGTSTSPLRPGKENCPPRDAEPNDGPAAIGPKTPTRAGRGYQLRTPLRSASRSSIVALVLSPCRSVKSVANRGTPATPERRLLKSQQQRMSLSPTAGLLEKLLAEDPNVLGNFDPTSADLHNMQFDFDNDLLNTDLTMPSSPPAGFSFFDDTDAGGMTDAWSDFLPSTPRQFNVDDIFDDPPDRHSSGSGGMQVDLSAFIEEHSMYHRGTDSEGSSPMSPIRSPKRTEAEKAAEAAELEAEIAELAKEAEEAARAAGEIS
ncbi:hypothetical protein EX30DRAFT_352606 [Ascodesmis nigricans]|uniref:Ams2/SPT21 N-terminal domain-containing protein n=1 Tax=Ascodesmis nigricans TaxID=341454 RepID=A0A4S2MIC3_9PEZI|nr:hypothetical protein EX30DRAFT_352606 [Ascodesmis nigricans]